MRDRSPGPERWILRNAVRMERVRLAVIGLELFVVRHAVEAMGGRAWALNRPEGGLELGFALRAHRPPASDDESADEESATV